MPQVFPHGLDTFYKELKRPMIAHNRWFSSFKASDYVQKNFSFSVQGEVAFPSGSLDDVVSLFDYVMRHAADWGLKVYELVASLSLPPPQPPPLTPSPPRRQDWLTLQYLQNDFPRSDVFAGSRWLNGMGLAAKKHNLRIQYCMPQPSDYHMSAQIEAVNQIRVSNDYPSEPEQWRIGKTSLFAWAVGLFPFKVRFLVGRAQRPSASPLIPPPPRLALSQDVFWTTQKEPGNVYFRLACWGLDQIARSPVSLQPQ